MVTIAAKTNRTIIDDSTLQDFNTFHCQDDYNNYAFSVHRSKGTTFIHPAVRNDSLVELKVGVLLPFHQSGNNKTKVMTMRYKK